MKRERESLSECVDTPAAAETMIWPRLSAVAEIGWTPQAERTLADFSRRFSHQTGRLDAMDVHYQRDRAIWANEGPVR